MKSEIKNFGTGGFNTDIAEFDLPPNLFTVARNVRVHDGKIGNIWCGYTDFRPTQQTPLEVAAFTNRELATYWVYCTEDKILVADPLPETTIGTVTGPVAYWTSCTLTDVPVFCTETEKPLYWPTVDSGTALQPLPWDVTDATDWDNAYGQVYRAEVIRPHKNFLFALNIREGLVKNNSLVHWSAPADPGNPPPTWKYREPDNLSGRIDIAETPGEIVDGLTLGDSFLVYKTDSVWRFQFVGGNAVFRRSRIQTLPGALSRKCIVDVEVGGGSHVVLGKEDLYIHNGQTFRSLITNRTRSRFLSLIDPDQAQKAFLVRNSQYKEVWICVPTTGSNLDSPVLAAVWSWEDDTWTERELPDLICAAEGKIQNPGRVLIKDMVDTCNDHRLINQVLINPQDIGLIGGIKATGLIHYDTDFTNNGTAFMSRISRTYLQLNDVELYNTINEAYPSADWLGGPGQINIRVGAHSTMRSPVRWDAWRSFDIRTGRHIHPRSTGALHAIELRSDDGSGWGLSSMLFNHAPAGRR